MTDPHDPPATGRRWPALLLLCAGTAGLLFTSGCNRHQMREAVGLRPQAPDEFLVAPREQPLAVPPGLGLNAPGKPGEDNRTQAQEQPARQSLREPGPGEPGPGELLLLDYLENSARR